MYLGNVPESKQIRFDIDIPAYVPPQPLEFVDVKTGQKKTFSIENAQKLANLIQQGYNLVQQIKGGTGQRKVVVVRSESDLKPTQAGFGKIALVFAGLLAAGTLFYTLRNR
jgi:hypothetical protein